MKRPEKKSGRLALLAVSFLWALALWFYAAEEMSQKRDLAVMPVGQEPVEMEVADIPVGVLLPAGVDVRAIPLAKTLSLKLSGVETRIAAVSASDIKVFVDASRLGEVKEEQELSFSVHVIPPEGIKVLPDSYPAMMTVKVTPRH